MDVGEMQKKLSQWAEQDKELRFFDLYHLLHQEDWIESMSPDEDEKGPTRRPPCAVKAARTVTTGGMGRHSTAVRPVPTCSGSH